MIRINLASLIDRPRRGGRWRFGLLIGLCSVAFLGTLGAASWTLTQKEHRLTQSVATALQELATAKEMLGGRAILREDLADLTKRVRSIQTLMRRRGTTLRILDALLDAVPHGLWITTLEGRGLELRARGSALSATAVADLMSRLHASGRFDDVDIIVSRQDLGEPLDAPLLFEVTCRFGG